MQKENARKCKKMLRISTLGCSSGLRVLVGFHNHHTYLCGEVFETWHLMVIKNWPPEMHTDKSCRSIPTGARSCQLDGSNINILCVRATRSRLLGAWHRIMGHSTQVCMFVFTSHKSSHKSTCTCGCPWQILSFGCKLLGAWHALLCHSTHGSLCEAEESSGNNGFNVHAGEHTKMSDTE